MASSEMGMPPPGSMPVPSPKALLKPAPSTVTFDWRKFPPPMASPLLVAEATGERRMMSVMERLTVGVAPICRALTWVTEPGLRPADGAPWSAGRTVTPVRRVSFSVMATLRT